ncbi:MAG: catalase [Hyphomicrobiales bacterium]
MSRLSKTLKIAGLSLIGVTAILWGADKFENKLPPELRGAEDLERATFDAIIKQIIADLEGATRAQPGTVTRDAHAKSHGCLKATFEVEDELPQNLKVGMFANAGAEYKAWVRFSNGAFKPRHDIDFDGRGLALKILNTPPTTKASETGPVDQFDILLGNYPVFFSPNPVDYFDFVKAGVLIGKPDGLRKYFMPNLNPFSWRIRPFIDAYTNSSLEITTPLNMQYFSMSPYGFGDKQQIKYTAKACTVDQADVVLNLDKSNPNYLRGNLKKHLDVAPACFALSVQVNDGSVSVEDASADWSEDVMPFQEIGRIKIPKQDFANAHSDDFCEHSDFNPARTPDEFQALGGLNRLRKEVYTAISGYRHGRNERAVSDPHLAWDKE